MWCSKPFSDKESGDFNFIEVTVYTSHFWTTKKIFSSYTEVAFYIMSV